MGSKTDSFENDILLLIFNNTAIANIGNAGGLQPSGVAGDLFVGLITDAVATSDSVEGTETTYTGYAREAVARSGAGWTVSTNNCSNTSAITFGQCTVGTPNIRYANIYTAVTAGDRLYWGQLDADLAVSPGITPEFAAGDLDINED